MRLFSLLMSLGIAVGTFAATPSPEEVKAVTDKVADWQIKTFDDQQLYRGIPLSLQTVLEEMGDRKPETGYEKYAVTFKKKWHDRQWHNAALYAGMNEWRQVADDGGIYTQWLHSIAERNDWKLHWSKYHADDHAVGHYYLALYEESRDPRMIADTVKRFDWIMANPKTGSLEWKEGGDCHKRWGWCDALFMAPPVWARLAKVTGERKYLDFMDQEYHATYDLLWSQEDQLFFRDSTYFDRRENNGAKIFWSRGNGWVFSGLALMIPDLPQDWDGRQFYIDMFKQMAESLKKTQREDGTWSMGLLGDPKDYPIPEASGTAFFTHGLAWGINNGLLDRAAYESVVLKAWVALTACVTEEGLLGHVQPVGASPGESYPDKTEVYGVGAFLSAGSEVYRLVGGIPGATRSPEQVKAEVKKVADWQIEHFHGDYQRKHKHNNVYTAWTYGACYVGLDKWAAMTGADEGYEFLKSIAEGLDWRLGKRTYHADDQLIGRLYLQLAEHYNDPEMYASIKARLDFILANPSKQSVIIKGKQQERWTWCDALFMAPPVWAQMARITGDEKYLDFMVKEYKATYDHLYDPEEHLFFRDSNYFKKRDNGRKIFWSRGNGWVFGGLALIIDELPEGKDKEWFVGLYKDMAPAIAKLQTPQGHWAMSLLCADAYPTPETSGSSFFTYGLAWGINQGYLDRAAYAPVVLKGWDALVSHVTADGMLGYVQPVGAAPGQAWPDQTEVYGIGAFLSAGSEVYKLVGGRALCPQSASDSRPFQTFMKDTGWCWYEDPRVIINNGKLIIGGISGKSGDAKVGVYDLKADKLLGAAVLYEKFERDDHDSPVFHVRPDGSLLTVYAKHGKEKIHHYHISDPQDYLKWGPRKEYHHTYEDKRGSTYMNLFTMKDEELLYCFFRDGQHFNPAFITSSDDGGSWGNYKHFITHDVGGRQRPYARYLQRDENTVGISFTDAHPRQFGNSLYYADFRKGSFFKADGTKIKDLSEGPLITSEAEIVYQGSGVKRKGGHGGSAANSAWSCAAGMDAERNPHLGYTVYFTNDDHRFRIASWTGSAWNDREIAYAGKCLYEKESSYTGLMAFDPENPQRVYISTDVDPATGKDSGGVHEIYTALIGAKDNVSTIKWEAVTSGSKYKNIRPIVVAGDGYKVLTWLGNGPWSHFCDYATDAIGMILERP
ncbi:glycoside hydrolase family 88 protein [Pontiella sulfatireligans]|uniref:Unsaturated rhamnogalacturonyl hydrolase YteR n=1 Tax=Pontiella sulfatireligans TaxID=2750658 RepID=A0A6C2UH54_9BACT|nr:glycoside hydrolase family 88 protein [Pontiella sulfatireligans]VGO19183.1 Unsaturated rhamnogalacturonyl hydrolase YteR [Pontiella sulfatireligans]